MSFKKFILAFSIALFAFSCSKENIIVSGVMDIGTLSESRFVTDNGMVLNIAENKSGKELTKYGRAVLRFDVLRKISENNYDIRILSINIPLTKPYTDSGTISEDELGKDLIFLKSGWFSGGYLNAELFIPVKKGSRNKHLINLVFDEAADNSDTLHFALRHNGYGEILDLSKPFEEQSDIVNGGLFASFPVARALPSGKNEMPVLISYTWYHLDKGGNLTGEIDTLTRKGTLHSGK